MSKALHHQSIAFALALGLGTLAATAVFHDTMAAGPGAELWPGGTFGLSNYENDNWVPIKGNRTVFHCSGYGCRKMDKFRFTDADIFRLALIMSEALLEDTATSERKAIAQAVAWMEMRVGRALGTNRDKASIGFFAAGQKGQQDCVDEARNTAAYLAVLHANGLIRHHGKAHVVNRGNLLIGAMPHYGVVIKEAAMKRLWAIDSGVGGNGKLPLIERAERWYARGGSRAPSSSRF